MYIHHVATITLVVGSHFLSQQRIGLLVLMVHDISDIFVDVLKLTNYLGYEGPRFLFAVEISFIANLFTFGFVRLYIFPVYVIRCTYFDSFVANGNVTVRFHV
jgi:ceramide synthetase